MTYSLYVLVDPLKPEEFKYIGITYDPVKRLQEHFRDAAAGIDSHKCNWIRKTNPIMKILEVGLSREDACAKECQLIQEVRASGVSLTNRTDGGEGVVNPSADVREKLAAWHRGKPLPYSTRQKLSASVKATWARKTTEEKAKHAAHSRGRIVSEKTRKKHTERLKEQWQNPEYRAARTSNMLGNTHLRGKKFPDRAVRHTFKRMSPTPETREKMRQAMVRYWTTKRGIQ